MPVRVTAHRTLSSVRLVLLLTGGAGAARAQPPGGSPNLPVFTSPIDVTGLSLVLVATAPDRETGVPRDIPLPPGVVGPKMARLLATPLNAQLDQYWSVAPDSRTGLVPRAAACDGPGGIKARVTAEVEKLGKRAHDVSCDLASTGRLVAKQIGSTILLGYLLTGNAVTFQTTSPQTCSPSGGSVFCPNDPRFTVRFAIELVTTLRAGGICELAADGGTVFIQGPSFTSHNAAADIARLFGGQRFVAAEAGMANTVRSQSLPLDGILAELRGGDLCARRVPGADRLLFAFRDFQPEIDPRRGILLRATHGGILAPGVSVVQPTPAGEVPAGGVPSFTRPMLSTAQPVITAGSAVSLRGQHFPTAVNLATTLPVGLTHDDRDNSARLGERPGGVCFGGGGTDVEFGPVGGPLRVERLTASAQGACAPAFAPQDLRPATAYQFRARDCDPFTCSPWSGVSRSTTTQIDRSSGKVGLELDRQVPLGVVAVDAAGNFDVPVTIPAGTAPGAHTIRAATRSVAAEVSVQVAAAGGGRASLTMVGLLRGETGCPNHPITTTQTDDTFLLFGAGFAVGAVRIALDGPDGASLGTVPVGPDGSFCQRLRSPGADKAGPHAIVGVQGGTAVARMAVTFVAPSVVR